MLWVQQVDILYTKASRGAPTATTRNRLPRAFVMHVGVDAAYVFEYYRLLEWKDFAPTLEKARSEVAPPRQEGYLVMEVSRDSIKLGLRWNHAIGQPPRQDKFGAITLAKG
jgi:hypothetical protein